MSELFNIAELIQDQSNWPKCPHCGQRTLLFGGELTCCSSCSFFGSVSAVSRTELMDFARAKMASRLGGSRGVIVMSCGARTRERDRMIAERASQLAQRLIHGPHFRNAQKVFAQKGEFQDLAILEWTPEEKQKLIDASDERQLAYQAASQDVVSVIRSRQLKEGVVRLTMETHIFNAPSHRRFADFNLTTKKWGPEEISQCEDIPSLIWQPIYWPIITNRPGSIQPRWVGALEIERDINVTLAVCENMDGPPLVRTAFRISRVEAPVIKEYSVGTAEEGIKLLKEKLQGVSTMASEPGVGKKIFEFEREWGIEENPHLISFQLRNAPFWKEYAEKYRSL